MRSDDLAGDYRNYDLADVDTTLMYGEVHNDPGAGESTPPGPLAEGQKNPEFDSLREALAKKDPAEAEEEIVTIDMPELTISNDPEADSVSESAVVSGNGELQAADEDDGTEDKEAMMERLRREDAEKKAAEALADPTAADDITKTDEKKNMIIPAIVFAVLLLAVMLILAFARDK